MTSDSGACNLITASHHYTNDTVHAAAACLEGGTDINSGFVYLNEIEHGVASGVIPEAAVRTALRNAYGFRMRLGLFDPDNTTTDKNRDIPVTAIGAAEHKEASLDAARQSLVLLKNDPPERGLPFTPGKRLAVIGTDVDSIISLMEPSNYNADNICPRTKHSSSRRLSSTSGLPDFSGGINLDCLSTIWRSLNDTNAQAGGTSTLLAKHCKDALDGAGCNETWSSTDIAAAVALAKAADYTVVVVSNAESEGGEGQDRKSIALAPDQMALAKAIFGALGEEDGDNGASHPTQAALMMINGGIMGIDSLRDDVDGAILEIFMPGAYGPQAVAETVFGKNVPGGKLPVTMYYSNYTDGLSIDDMSMQAGQGRTYRYFDGPVVYPFGHGVSYTTFSLQWSPPPGRTVLQTAGDSTTYTVEVKNTGAVFTADEVVLAFFKPKRSTIASLRDSSTPVVIKQLFGFERVRLAPGSSQQLKFTVNATQVALADGDGHTSLHPGEYEIVFSRGCVGCAELTTALAVDAPAPIRLKSFRRWW